MSTRSLEELLSLPEDALVDTLEASILLKRRALLLAEWRQQNLHLPFIKVGRFVRYRVGDIREWLRRQHRVATAPAE